MIGGWISLTLFALPFTKGREQALAFLCSLYRTATLPVYDGRSLARSQADRESYRKTTQRGVDFLWLPIPVANSSTSVVCYK